MRKTTSLFVEVAQKVHGDKFDYSDVEYVNTHKIVRIKCRQCGVVFMQEPAHDSSRTMVMQTTCKDKDLFANIGFYAAFLFFLQLSGTFGNIAITESSTPRHYWSA